ncbi:MAG: hypothetical protein K8S62_05300 [Candidatus Sabulitectum sp.]|nr:hypothetical protein [Candidatus Sabulitectum sp.]
MMILLAAMIAFGAAAPIAPAASTVPVDEVTPLIIFAVLHGTVSFDDSDGYVIITFTDEGRTVSTEEIYNSGSWELHPVGILEEVGELEAHFYRNVGDDQYRYEYDIEYTDDYIWMPWEMPWGNGYHWCHQKNFFFPRVHSLE